MSQQAYDELIQVANVQVGSLPETMVVATDQYNSELIGSLPQSDNEIVIPASNLSQYFQFSVTLGQSLTDNISQYLNKEIALDLSNYGLGQQQFKITVIINDL